MINKLGCDNINQIVQLGYKPGRLSDIWKLYFGRNAHGACMWCSEYIVPMRLMRRCSNIHGAYPVAAECFIVINGNNYPGIPGIYMLSHKQRASLAGLICQNCWINTANCQPLVYT